MSGICLCPWPDNRCDPGCWVAAQLCATPGIQSIIARFARFYVSEWHGTGVALQDGDTLHMRWSGPTLAHHSSGVSPCWVGVDTSDLCSGNHLKGPCGCVGTFQSTTDRRARSWRSVRFPALWVTC